MITVLQTYGLRVVIFRFDHEPPHVHVIGDGVARIFLGDATHPPVIDYAKGMNNAEQRRALKAVKEAQMELLKQWSRIHG